MAHRINVILDAAAYHALALADDGLLVTADEKYLAAVASEPRAIHLRGWQ